MLRWFGVSLLLIACGGIGIQCSRTLRKRVFILRSILEKMERICMEVCRLQTPLPEILPMLTGRTVDADELREHSFSEIWKRETAAADWEEPERHTMEELGCALSRGDEPERAFMAAQERLHMLLREAEAEAESKCRLYSSLGICMGLLLTIVLI